MVSESLTYRTYRLVNSSDRGAGELDSSDTVIITENGKETEMTVSQFLDVPGDRYGSMAMRTTILEHTLTKNNENVGFTWLGAQRFSPSFRTFLDSKAGTDRKCYVEEGKKKGVDHDAG